jgi:lipoprotein-releasing system ATP-binding protein
MNAPSLILADEPTGNLDRESSEQVLDLLQAINRDQGTTFLISTHDPHVAERCGRRFHVLDGQVTAS